MRIALQNPEPAPATAVTVWPHDPPRAAALSKLVTALQTRPGHVAVIGPDAAAAMALVREAELLLGVYRRALVSGAALDPDAAVAALTAGTPGSGRPWVRERVAMQVLVDEARRAGMPVVVVVADADAAPARDLDRLHRRLDCVRQASEVVRIVLVGGPRLVEELRRREARSIATSVVAVVRLPAAVPIALDAPPRRRGPRRHAIAAALLGLAAASGWRLAARPPRPADDARRPAATAAVAPTPPASTAPLAVAAATAVPPPPAAGPPAVVAADAPPRARQLPARRARERALQVAAFVDSGRAETVRRDLAARFPDVYVSDIGRAGATYHRVRVGGFTSDAARLAAATTLRKAGYEPRPAWSD